MPTPANTGWISCDAEYGQVLLPTYAASPDAVAYRFRSSLADYTDDQLISELARRLRNRG